MKKLNIMAAGLLFVGLTACSNRNEEPSLPDNFVNEDVPMPADFYSGWEYGYSHEEDWEQQLGYYHHNFSIEISDDNARGYVIWFPELCFTNGAFPSYGGKFQVSTKQREDLNAWRITGIRQVTEKKPGESAYQADFTDDSEEFISVTDSKELRKIGIASIKTDSRYEQSLQLLPLKGNQIRVYHVRYDAYFKCKGDEPTTLYMEWYQFPAGTLLDSYYDGKVEKGNPMSATDPLSQWVYTDGLGMLKDYFSK